MSAYGVAGILRWAAFPLAGALLGFCAARIAARFIARPSFLGRLAASARARPALRGAISRITDGILDRPLCSFLPADRGALTQSVQRLAKALLGGLVSSPSFLRAVRETVSGKVASLSARTVKDVMDDTGLSHFLSETLLARLGEEENRRAIARSIGSAVEKRAGTPADALGPALSGVLGPLVPAAVDRLVEGLKSGQTRAVLASRGRELLPKILDKLNVLQRLLLSAGQFDRRIDEKMPEIVDETITAIEQVARDPLQQKLFLDKVLEGVRDWRSSPSRSEIGPAAAALAEQALARLADPEARRQTARSIEGFLGGGGQTVGSALRQRFGVRDAELADAVANAALEWFSRPETQEELSQRLAALASRFLEENAASPIRALLKIDAGRKERLDELLAANAAALGGGGAADGAAPAARWAGLFGAGLGLLIGLAEMLLGLFLLP